MKQTCCVGFQSHFSGRFFKREEQTDDCLLTIDGAPQIANHAAVDMTALDTHQHGLQLAVPIGERDDAIDAAVSTLLFLAAQRLRVDSRPGARRTRLLPRPLAPRRPLTVRACT